MAFKRRKDAKLQAKIRTLLLEKFFKIDYEGKDQRQILELCEEEFVDELLALLYDYMSTILSRFLRSVMWLNPITGKNERALFPDQSGRWWHMRTIMNVPELRVQFMKVQDEQIESDLDSRNRTAEELEKQTGKRQPRARIIYDLFDEE